MATVSECHPAYYSQLQEDLDLLWLGIEPMASHILGKSCPAELGPQLLGHVYSPTPLFNIYFFNTMLFL